MKPKTTEPVLPRFLINPNKVEPYSTIGVGDWVAFDLFDGDCKIGKIIEFIMNDHTSTNALAIIQMPNDVAVERNIFHDIENGTIFKIDHYCTTNIEIIKED
jgi:hypothetical protein